MAGKHDDDFNAVSAHLRGTAARAAQDLLRDERTPQKTLELSSTAVQLFELATQLALQTAFPEGSPLACGQGCSWCCYQRVTTTPPLAFCVADGLRGALSEADRAALLEQICTVHDAVRGKAAQARRELRVACPLLQGAGQCMAHPARPLACRGWNSHDAGACRKTIDEPSPLSATKVFVAQFRFAQSVEEGLQEGLGVLGLQAGQFELVGALRAAFEDPDAHVRWLRGERVFDEDLTDEGDAVASWIHALGTPS